MSDFDLDSIAPERRDPSEKVTDKKVVTKTSVPSAVPTALAPPPTAPVAQAAEPELPASVPQLNVPTPQTPVSANPINGEFLKTAAATVGIPALLGAGGAYIGNKLFGNQRQQPQASAGPSEIEQVRLEREKFKLEQEMLKAEREQAAYDAKQVAAYEAKQAAAQKQSAFNAPVPEQIPQPTAPKPVDYSLTPASAYGQTTLNAPTGAPNVAAPPPAEVAPAPVSPAERRAQELHEAKLKQINAQTAAIEAKAAITNSTPAKAAKSVGGSISPGDAALFSNQQKSQLASEAAAAQAAAIEAKKPKPVPAPVATPAATVAQTPITPVTPAVPAPEVTALTKEQKGMKNYLVSQYGGGPEGEAAYKKVIEILGETPAYEKGQGGGLSKEANNLIKDWRKANIEGPKVNLTHDMKKVMKGAGGLAILTALPGFAEAAQNKDVGKMGDIFTDFFVLPFAQSRGVNEGEEQELAKRRYEGAVGGGRGIAPPSAYQR